MSFTILQRDERRSRKQGRVATRMVLERQEVIVFRAHHQDRNVHLGQRRSVMPGPRRRIERDDRDDSGVAKGPCGLGRCGECPPTAERIRTRDRRVPRRIDNTPTARPDRTSLHRAPSRSRLRKNDQGHQCVLNRRAPGNLRPSTTGCSANVQSPGRAHSRVTAPGSTVSGP